MRRPAWRLALLAILMLATVVTACSSAPRFSPIAIPTSEPAAWFGLVGGCPTALIEGVLAPSAESVVGLAGADGIAHPVRWPNGWFATDDNGLVLRDGRGGEVAREGEFISAGGGMDAQDRLFIVCGEVHRAGKS